MEEKPAAMPDRAWLLRNIRLVLEHEGVHRPGLAEILTDHLAGNWEMILMAQRAKAEKTK